MTDYLITAPLYQAMSEEVGEALIENVINKFGMPEYMIMDQDSVFISSLMSYLFKKLEISIKTGRSLQPQIFEGRIWYKVIVKHFVKTLDRSRANMA